MRFFISHFPRIRIHWIAVKSCNFVRCRYKTQKKRSAFCVSPLWRQNSRQVPLGQLLAHRLVSLHYQNNQACSQPAVRARVCETFAEETSMILLSLASPCSARHYVISSTFKKVTFAWILYVTTTEMAREVTVSAHSARQTFTFASDASLRARSYRWWVINSHFAARVMKYNAQTIAEGWGLCIFSIATTLFL